MSTVYSDAAGNKYLGDCRWSNHDIAYPSTSYLLANPHSTISQGLTNLCSSVAMSSYSILSQASFDATLGRVDLMTFRFSGDTGTGSFRYTFRTEVSWAGAQGNSGDYSIGMASDAGSLILIGKNNGFAQLNGNGHGLTTTPSAGGTYSWAACATQSYLSLAVGAFAPNKSPAGLYIWAAGTLLNVNTNFNYYSASRVSQSFLMCGNTTIRGGHYIESAGKDIYQTGRAAYTISCSDGQTPTTQWATDMWVFDNNATLGYPVIGRVPNFLLGIGSYTYMKPVKIIGSVFPDNGSPWYLPVGTYAGKTLLMRCYSSMN